MKSFTGIDVELNKPVTIDDALLKSLQTEDGLTLYDEVERLLRRDLRVMIVRLIYRATDRQLPLGYVIQYAKSL